MHVDEGHEHHAARPHKHLLRRFEGATDLMVVALIVLLGGAMLWLTLKRSLTAWPHWPC